MKYLAIPFILIGFIFFTSCKKAETEISQSGFIKTITGDSDVTVIESLQLTDGNYLIVSSDQKKLSPGHMVKLDAAGNLLWEKRVDKSTNTIWKAFLIPGNMYAIIGCNTEDNQSKNLNICIYNNEGELTATKLLPTGTENSYKSPADVLQLSNGNFVIAFGEWGAATGHYLFTDNNFNLLSIRSFIPPLSSTVAGCSFRKICETSEGEIIFTGATSNNAPWGEIPESYTMILKTDLAGIQKSFNVVINPGYNEIPNCLIRYKEGILLMSARKSDLNNMGGTFVNYRNGALGSETVSGRISLCTYDNDGVLQTRKEISEYSKNGQISSIKQAADGGFIMCGTVGQANSSVVVSANEIFLLKVDASLNVQWSKNIATPYPSIGVDVITMGDGGYLVSGQQRSYNDHYDAVVIRTDANGNY